VDGKSESELAWEVVLQASWAREYLPRRGIQRNTVFAMASVPAIRFITSSVKSTLGSVHLQCHVKPGASKQREGVLAITDDAINLCVTAQARDGEANKAVREMISEILGIPKSSVELIKGHKSRDKTIAILGVDAKGDEESCIARIREQLQTLRK
jgi:uncharacterized protein